MYEITRWVVGHGMYKDATKSLKYGLMDYILDKYVSPRVLMTLGFSSLWLAARGRWVGKTFSEGVSLEEASVSIG
jgi:hypothetical protein